MLKRGLLMIVTLQLQRQRIASSREKFDDDGLHSYHFSSRSGDSKKFSTVSFVDGDEFDFVACIRKRSHLSHVSNFRSRKIGIRFEVVSYNFLIHIIVLLSN